MPGQPLAQGGAGRSNGYPSAPTAVSESRAGDARGVGAEPPCSCRRHRAGVRARCVRFDRWAQHCDVPSAQPGHYASLLEKAQIGPPFLDEQTRRQVHLDVERSCPALSFFQGGGGRHMLINILFAWVVHDANTHEESEQCNAGKPLPAVGYVQGMSFIAMNLLWHAGKEEAAFWVFAAMMQRYDLRQMFEPPDMRGLQMRSFTIAQLLQYTMPELSKHLAEYLQNSLGLILTDWLLTLFSSSMALGPLAELWDRFFVGGYRTIYCLILARLRCLQPWLLREKDFTRLTHLIRVAHVNFDRVDGVLVPRLRGAASPADGAGSHGNGVATSAEATGTLAGSGSAGRLFQRFVSGAASAASLVVHGSSLRGLGGLSVPRSDGEVELDAKDAIGAGRQAAWTCQDCNGSEDCESWLTLVSELADAEQIQAGVIEAFEQIFDGSSTVPLPLQPPSRPAASNAEDGGPRAEASRKDDVSPEGVANEVSLPVDEIKPCDHCAKLAKEVECLRAENEQLRAECQEVTSLRRALAEARKELEELKSSSAPAMRRIGD